MKKKTIQFKFEKHTLRTAKFEEVPAPGEPPVVGSLYLQKWFVPSAGPGTTITVEVAVPDSTQASPTQQYA